MKIALFGGTGGTGLAFMEYALEKNYELCALVRSKDAITNFPSANLKVVEGDVLNLSQVEKTVEGADFIVSALGVRKGQPVGRVRSEGTKNIIQAAKSLNTLKKAIFISAVGARDSLPNLTFPGKWLIPKIIGKERVEELNRQEALIKESGIPWVIIRAPRLLDKAQSKKVVLANELKSHFSSNISRLDLATGIHNILEAKNSVGHELTIRYS